MTFTKRQADAIRSIVALPADDWTPYEWDTFEVARGVLRGEIESHDRAKAKKDADDERTAPSRIRSVSKRKSSRVPPAAKQALVERSGYLCEAADALSCGTWAAHQAQEIHHLAGRLGKDPHRLSNLLHVCSNAHRWIGDHPSYSYARGWMVKRNGVNG